jgi:hypothetical protein
VVRPPRHAEIMLKRPILRLYPGYLAAIARVIGRRTDRVRRRAWLLWRYARPVGAPSLRVAGLPVVMASCRTFPSVAVRRPGRSQAV